MKSIDSNNEKKINYQTTRAWPVVVGVEGGLGVVVVEVGAENWDIIALRKTKFRIWNHTTSLLTQIYK